MVRKVLLSVLATGVLAACQPTAPACTSPADREIRTIDRLIKDTRATIARGYTTERRDGASVNFCLGSGGDNVGVSFCSDGGTQRVAIDPAAESRKLEALLARRDALVRKSSADRAACTGVSR